MKDCDIVMFGATDSAVHFHLVLLFLHKKEVFVFDPFHCATAKPSVSRFLQMLFQHSSWLDSNAKEFDLSECMFTDEEAKMWDIMNVDHCDGFMPRPGDGTNCGFDVSID